VTALWGEYDDVKRALLARRANGVPPTDEQVARLRELFDQAGREWRELHPHWDDYEGVGPDSCLTEYDWQLLMIELGVDEATTIETAASERRSRRKPIPQVMLEQAVKLIVDGAGRNEVHRRTRLSTRIVDGLFRDVEAGSLDWNERDRLVTPAGTRATRDGLVLPERS
jgi:hypothetical protein